MREIKFRVWHKLDKCWVTNENKESETELDYNNKYLMHWNNYELLQFTGFKDKNGKEVYEGDVVHFTPKQDGTAMIHDWSDGSPYRRQVKWDEEHGCLTFAYINGETRTSGYTFCKHNMETICEVIGNIYESPKLLVEEE